MKYGKGIWKTAAFAITVTFAFAIFAFNFEDWTKGLSSEFVVYGQTGSGTGGSTGGTTGAAGRVAPR